jgi:hypothetical protein
MGPSEDRGTSFGSSFYPPLRVPSNSGMVVLVFYGLMFDLTPWSQVMINHIVESIYPDCGQKDTTVVLFQEKNLRELNAMFLRVVVDGDRYCVKAYLVEANTPVPATNAAGECKPEGGTQPKPGFSRGVGEGC